MNFNRIYNFFDDKTDVSRSQAELQFKKEVDSLLQVKETSTNKIYPFNPNYITDYKGYMLGMSIEEIDRLHKFRSQNKFVNSAKEFQQVTKVSNELLAKISPFFKFPDWVVNKQNSTRTAHSFVKKESVVQINLNSATKEELMKVYGIGEKLSDNILNEKSKLGEFVSIDQISWMWGITPETFENVKKQFFVKPISGELKKIKINSASSRELSQFPYFNYAISKEIVTYRSMNGEIRNIEDLTKIKGISVDKIKIIVLYLEFD
ncbi:ComEA family DNA-binding protein [Flavobacterium haoranii]|uniref:ComEA family DNA-binding protein n=1 Tax=Flavobacterium haoranii TaxID=683124 RepID=UPI001D0DE98A|nr:helix-hairpin-helix domain-containing protein [Flavobacterium haoranii]